jgi:hypothetical protein
MGETKIRFLKVNERRVKGEKRRLMVVLLP